MNEAIATLVSIIEDRNTSLRLAKEEAHDLYSKIQFLMDNVVETEDGSFTFADGDSWSCKVKVK